MTYDITIIGAGIVGLASAYKILQKNPTLNVCIIEKETTIAQHQTGHNSGVIHSGIYYKPGSLKAINCQKGYGQLLKFAKKHDIKHDVCGKVIVATKEAEFAALEKIYNRGISNGLKGIKKITPSEVKAIEPYVKSVAAIWVPQAGIIDYKDVAKKYEQLVIESGAQLFFGHVVIDIIEDNNEIRILSNKKEFKTKKVISCAGLFSDKMAKLTQQNIDVQILPFRGEYYELIKEKEYLVNNLIYPVPNPDFPFLGVHYTRMIKGGIEAGPNAVLAFRREGYSRWDFQFKELMETLRHPGFQKIAAKYWRDGLGELYRSYSKRAFVKALQHLIPDVGINDLKRGGAGVRAQAADTKGNLIDDFFITERKGIINVINAPSPAATSSLAIGDTIATKVLKQLMD